MRRLRLGFIGTGLASKLHHLPALKKLEDRFELVAAVNRSRYKAESFARAAGIRVVADTVPDLLAMPEIEAVVVAVPIDQTARCVVQALRAGKHVLAERPLALTVEEGRRLVAAASKFPQKVLIAENFFFAPCMVKAVQLVKNGTLGQVRLVTVKQSFWLDEKNPYTQSKWRQRPKHAGGFLLDSGLHTANLLREMLGMPVEVKCLLKQSNPKLPPADSMAACMEFRNGAIGVWQSSFAARPIENEVLELYGSKANLVVSWDATRLIQPNGSEKVFRYDEDGYDEEFRHFYEVVVGNRKPAFTLRQALADLEFMMKLLGK